nr:MAG TPA: hypothetical protein [Caudoviricetes sp.]
MWCEFIYNSQIETGKYSKADEVKKVSKKRLHFSENVRI